MILNHHHIRQISNILQSSPWWETHSTFLAVLAPGTSTGCSYSTRSSSYRRCKNPQKSRRPIITNIQNCTKSFVKSNIAHLSEIMWILRPQISNAQQTNCQKSTSKVPLPWQHPLPLYQCRKADGGCYLPLRSPVQDCVGVAVVGGGVVGGGHLDGELPHKHALPRDLPCPQMAFDSFRYISRHHCLRAIAPKSSQCLICLQEWFDGWSDTNQYHNYKSWWTTLYVQQDHLRMNDSTGWNNRSVDCFRYCFW